MNPTISRTGTFAPSASCETRDMTTGEAAAYRLGQASAPTVPDLQAEFVRLRAALSWLLEPHAACRASKATVTHAVRSPPEISQDIAYSMWGLLERAVLTVPGMYTVWHDDAHKVLSKCKRETGTP